MRVTMLAVWRPVRMTSKRKATWSDGEPEVKRFFNGEDIDDSEELEILFDSSCKDKDEANGICKEDTSPSLFSRHDLYKCSDEMLKPALNVVGIKRKASSMNVVDSSGFVRRLASLNASACVTALLEPEKLKPRLTSQPSSPQNNNWSENEVSECASDDSDANDEVMNCVNPLIQNADAESFPYNTVGLLYNGDTVHPNAQIFLSEEEKFIVPIVMPASLNTITSLIQREKGKAPKKRKTKRGDNGWTSLGEPIKRIEYLDEHGVKRIRKYFIGIQRKNEEIFVRDCIILKAGVRKQERPYIAKVASFWQENGSVMMTVFWYYRPEDIAGSDFHENELLASQHYDENSVACIEEKCCVLGLTQFCRYLAGLRRPLSKQSSLQNLVVPSSSHVYLCYRGYNHLVERVIRTNML